MSGFRGVSSDQDSRFKSKERLLLKTKYKFEPDQKAVDFSGVNWEVIKPWLSKRVTELLGGIEDDIVILYIEEQVVGKKSFDPRQLVVNISGFLEGPTETFVRELWSLLVSASKSTSGIPESFLKKKQTELQIKQEEDLKVLQHIERSRHTS
jgi:serine/arginine repetitive matrix protein 1